MQDLESEVYALVRPYFRNDEVARAWIQRRVPVFEGKTPVEFAAEQGLETLRQHLQRFFHSEGSA